MLINYTQNKMTAKKEFQPNNIKKSANIKINIMAC